MTGATQDTAGLVRLALQGCHLLWRTFQYVQAKLSYRYAVLQPQLHLRATGLGFSHFDRLYSGNDN